MFRQVAGVFTVNDRLTDDIITPVDIIITLAALLKVKTVKATGPDHTPTMSRSGLMISTQVRQSGVQIPV